MSLLVSERIEVQIGKDQPGSGTEVWYGEMLVIIKTGRVLRVNTCHHPLVIALRVLCLDRSERSQESLGLLIASETAAGQHHLGSALGPDSPVG